MKKETEKGKISGKKFLVELSIFSIIWFSIPLSKNYDFLIFIPILFLLIQLIIDHKTKDCSAEIGKTTKEKIVIFGILLLIIFSVLSKSFSDIFPFSEVISSFFDDPKILYKFYIPVWFLVIFYMFYRWYQDNEDTLNKDLKDIEQFNKERKRKENLHIK